MTAAPRINPPGPVRRKYGIPHGEMELRSVWEMPGGRVGLRIGPVGGMAWPPVHEIPDVPREVAQRWLDAARGEG